MHEVSMIRSRYDSAYVMIKCVCVCVGVSWMCVLKAYQWNEKDTQEENFSLEPEVGVVIAKTTMQYRVSST